VRFFCFFFPPFLAFLTLDLFAKFPLPPHIPQDRLFCKWWYSSPPESFTLRFSPPPLPLSTPPLGETYWPVLFLLRHDEAHRPYLPDLVHIMHLHHLFRFSPGSPTSWPQSIPSPLLAGPDRLLSLVSPPCNCLQSGSASPAYYPSSERIFSPHHLLVGFLFRRDCHYVWGFPCQMSRSLFWCSLSTFSPS